MPLTKNKYKEPQQERHVPKIMHTTVFSLVLNSNIIQPYYKNNVIKMKRTNPKMR